MKVFLIGYMGSGKSTVGRILAEKLNLPFYDTDLLIEEKIGCTITDLFKAEGEQAFRKLEHQILLEIKNEYSDGIFATGGGMPCFNQNMGLINSLGTSCYLKCGIQVLVDRLKKSQDRPLIQSQSEKEAFLFIKNHLAKRKSFYARASFTVLGRRAPEKVANRIAFLLDSN